jgi:hypothetical protein
VVLSSTIVPLFDVLSKGGKSDGTIEKEAGFL